MAPFWIAWLTHQSLFVISPNWERSECRLRNLCLPSESSELATNERQRCQNYVFEVLPTTCLNYNFLIACLPPSLPFLPTPPSSSIPPGNEDIIRQPSEDEIIKLAPPPKKVWGQYSRPWSLHLDLTTPGTRIKQPTICNQPCYTSATPPHTSTYAPSLSPPKVHHALTQDHAGCHHKATNQIVVTWPLLGKLQKKRPYNMKSGDGPTKYVAVRGETKSTPQFRSWVGQCRMNVSVILCVHVIVGCLSWSKDYIHPRGSRNHNPCLQSNGRKSNKRSGTFSEKADKHRCH